MLLTGADSGLKRKTNLASYSRHACVGSALIGQNRFDYLKEKRGDFPEAE
jgi:hypothetical protein